MKRAHFEPADGILKSKIGSVTEGLFHRVIAESPVIEWIAEYSNWQPMSVAENYMDAEAPGYHYSSREIVNTLLMEEGLALDRETAKTLQDSMGNGEIEDSLGHPTSQLCTGLPLLFRRLENHRRG